MLKAFIACRVSGEEPEALRQLLGLVCATFRKIGVDAYCTVLDPDETISKSTDAKAVMEHAFSVIDGVDFLFVLQTGSEKSEGMLIEFGYARKGRIPIVVATMSEVHRTYLPQLADQSIVWDEIKDLLAQIETLQLPVAVAT